jgi:hypothetical protein
MSMFHTIRFPWASLAGLAVCAAVPMAAATGEPAISGPYTHENLSIYLIHSAPGEGRARLLTLEEALEQKKVVVYETSSVNELAIENLSAETVYIQAGDIVKGGKQDRVFPIDSLVPPKSGRLPIGAFCVEHGRWSRRGGEAADQFSSSNRSVAFKSLKLAVVAGRDQSEVWDEVSAAQSGLAAKVAAAPPSPSPSSLQLSLESRQVVVATDSYVRALTKVLEGQSQVVGFAYAINGELSGADVYSSASLFSRMWPKLIQASATEAIAARGDKAQAAPSTAAVRSALAEADGGRESSRRSAGRALVERKDSADALLLETRDEDAGAAWIHKSYIVK